MENINNPKLSVSDFKCSPMSPFRKAEESNSGVYIIDGDEASGVILTRNQYESLYDEIEDLYERIDEFTVKERLADNDRKLIPVSDVIGFDLKDIEFDENDGRLGIIQGPRWQIKSATGVNVSGYYKLLFGKGISNPFSSIFSNHISLAVFKSSIASPCVPPEPSRPSNSSKWATKYKELSTSRLDVTFSV